MSRRLLLALCLALGIHGLVLLFEPWPMRPPQLPAVSSGITVALEQVAQVPQAAKGEPVKPLPEPRPESVEDAAPADPVKMVQPPELQAPVPQALPSQLAARKTKVRHPLAKVPEVSEPVPVVVEEKSAVPQVTTAQARNVLPEQEAAIGQEEAAPAATAVLRRMAAPSYQDNPPPFYPAKARRRGWQGRVLLEVRVTATGVVAGLKVEQSSGHPILDQAALKAVRDWRFVPALAVGRPVADIVTVPVHFQLR